MDNEKEVNKQNYMFANRGFYRVQLKHGLGLEKFDIAQHIDGRWYITGSEKVYLIDDFKQIDNEEINPEFKTPGGSITFSESGKKWKTSDGKSKN